MYIYIYMHIYIHAYIYTHAYVHIHRHVHIHIDMHIFVYIYISHTKTLMHTHTHYESAAVLKGNSATSSSHQPESQLICIYTYTHISINHTFKHTLSHTHLRTNRKRSYAKGQRRCIALPRRRVTTSNHPSAPQRASVIIQISCHAPLRVRLHDRDCQGDTCCIAQGRCVVRRVHFEYTYIDIH